MLIILCTKVPYFIPRAKWATCSITPWLYASTNFPPCSSIIFPFLLFKWQDVLCNIPLIATISSMIFINVYSHNVKYREISGFIIVCMRAFGFFCVDSFFFQFYIIS